MAVVAWMAAVVAAPVSMVVALAVVFVGIFARRPVLLIVGVALLATAAGHRADEAYQQVVPGPFADVVSAVIDARPFGPGWRLEVRLRDGTRVEATGFGSVGVGLAAVAAGDHLVVAGRLKPIDDTGWSRSRHLVGRLDLTAATIEGSSTPGRPVVEWFRSAIVAGAEPLRGDRHSLYLGLVIGDDRFQTPAQRARFRAAGLTHLLAVSGQNVAFVLAVVRPLVQLAARPTRLLMTIAVLVLFAFATRLEPSVLRATATAGLAAWATMSGRPQSGLRLLGLATTGLVIIDPFLVHSVGFQLSIAASAGILALAPLFVAHLPGPGFVVEPLAITVAAQLAVLPLLLHYFGPVSAASIPANLLGGWAAGLIMMWGLTVGVVAGLGPAWLGSWLQAPSGALLWWLDGVAAWAARLPLPMVDQQLGVLVAAVVAIRWLLARHWRRSGAEMSGSLLRPTVLGLAAARFVVAVVVVLVIAASIKAVPRPPESATVLGGGGLWLPPAADLPSVLVVTREADRRLLDSILDVRIRQIDIVVSESGGGEAATVSRAVAELAAVGIVLGPPQHRIVGATRVTSDLLIETGQAVVRITTSPTSLTVELTR